MKNERAFGPDNHPVHTVEEEYTAPLKDVFKYIYRSGIIPQEWLTFTFITIPKKSKAKHDMFNEPFLEILSETHTS